MNGSKILYYACVECMRPNLALVSAGVMPWVGEGNSVDAAWDLAL